jgi:photosystem II stability/assembly factor-like uncharacterized protein
MILIIKRIKMKTIIYLLIFLVFFFETVITQNANSGGWFWQYPKPQGNTLNDIFIFNRDTAIAVGDLGTVIKTTNGGTSWDVQHHAGGTTFNLLSVHFNDSMNGWAVGGMKYPSKNILLKTGDGGKNWIEITTDTSLRYRAVYFIDADTGFVAGENGILLRTTDGGKSWDTKKIDNYIGYGWLDVFDLYEITFTDKQTGWIVGFGYYGNQIYKTTDCGRTWQWNEQIVLPKVYSEFNDICFTDSNHGFIIGGMGDFLKTTDGGITWQYQNLYTKYPNPYFNSICFIDSLRGWIIGVSFILETKDGGENWSELNTEIGLLKVRFAKVDGSLSIEQAGWIVGGYGIIYRTTDAGDNWIKQSDKSYNFRSIYFTDENTGWAVGDSGIILSTTDGGNNWIKQLNADSVILSSVYAIDNQNVFAVGSVLKGSWPSFTDNGIIFKTNDGGNNWTKQSFDTLSTFSSVVFTNDSIGWITVTNGTILKTTNRGKTWEQFSSGLGTMLSNIQFINNNIGWVSFQGGKYLLKTIDGGKNWNSQFIDSNFSMYSFHFVNSNKGLTVGSYFGYNNIFKTTDGGENWEPSKNVPISHYNSVKFINENIGWISGGYQLSGIFNSMIIKTTDGGISWVSQNGPTTQELSSLFFINENTGWVVGDGIFKTTNGGGTVYVKNDNNYRNNIPKQIELFQNYPNPFNPITTISFTIPSVGTSLMKSLQLKIYDILGREVAVLVNEKRPARKYTVQWNAEKFSSGLYFYRLTAGEFSETKKMILLR